jgi:hypothetical protein
MFDTQDISLLRQLLLEQDVKLLSTIQHNSETLRTELRSELRSDIRASADDLRDELGARIQKTETSLREDLGGKIQSSSDALRSEMKTSANEMRGDIALSADGLQKELGGKIQKTEVALRGEIRSSANGLRKEFSVAIRQSADDVKREIRDEMRSLIVASEKRIIESVADFIDSSVISQISALQQDVIRIKQNIQLV